MISSNLIRTIPTMMADILLDNLNVFGRLLRSLSLKGNMLSVTDLSYDRPDKN